MQIEIEMLSFPGDNVRMFLFSFILFGYSISLDLIPFFLIIRLTY